MIDLRRFISFGLFVTVVLLALFIPISITGSQVALGLGLVLWLAILLFDYRPELLRTPISLGFLFWIGASLVSVLASETKLESLLMIREEWLFLTFFIVIAAVNSPERWRWLNVALAVAILVSSVYAIWQHFSGLDLSHGHLLRGMESGYRVHSTMSGYLTAGAVFSLAGLWLIPSAYLLRKWKRYLLFSAGGLSLVAAFLSYNRSTVIGIIVGVGLLLILLLPRLSWRLLIPIGAAGLFVLIVQPDLFFRFQREDLDARKPQTYFGGDSKRMEIWTVAVEMFADHPLVGVGRGNFSKYYNQYHADRSRSPQSHAHNDILHLAATHGIVGVVAYLFLWGALGWRLWQSYRRRRDPTGIIAATGLVVIAVFLVISLFEAYFLDEEVRTAILFLVALSFSGLKLAGETAEN